MVDIKVFLEKGKAARKKKPANSLKVALKNQRIKEYTRRLGQDAQKRDEKNPKSSKNSAEKTTKNLVKNSETQATKQSNETIIIANPVPYKANKVKQNSKNGHPDEQIARNLNQELNRDKILHEQSRETLELKSKIYEKLSTQETNQLTKEKFLIDFDRKKMEELLNHQSYEQERAEFYEQLKQQKREEHRGYRRQLPEHVELGKRMLDMEQERLAWEKEALEGIGKEFDELDDLRKRYFIKQSYDRRMTKKDQEKLKEVLEEEEKEKSRILKVKEMRLEAKRKREEKLKRLKMGL